MIFADVIVVGTGGVGSAALYHLARAGTSVVGFDRFPAAHDRGSSHGQTRVIRQAYFEHPSYVPLLRRAYELWRELERDVDASLYHEVGLLEVGPADGIVIPGVRQAAREHNLLVDELTTRELDERFPSFSLPKDSVALFEREAGYLLVEDCVRSHIEAAMRHGATHYGEETVLHWSSEQTHVSVTTDRAEYQADALVIAGGCWSSQLLAGIGTSLKVTRKHLHWFRNDDERLRQDAGCPTFFVETPTGFFYGFPQIDERGVKVAEHSGGSEISDPLNLDRSIDHVDLQRIAAFLQDHLPSVSGATTAHEVCMYTMSPDEHFIIDRHPDSERVVFAAGLSGHGFKFTSLIGEVLTQLTTQGETTLPIDFLRLNR